MRDRITLRVPVFVLIVIVSSTALPALEPQTNLPVPIEQNSGLSRPGWPHAAPARSIIATTADLLI